MIKFDDFNKMIDDFNKMIDDFNKMFDDFNKMIALNSMILINLVQGFDDNPSLGFIKIRSLVRRLSLFIIIYNI